MNGGCSRRTILPWNHRNPIAAVAAAEAGRTGGRTAAGIPGVGSPVVGNPAADSPVADNPAADTHPSGTPPAGNLYIKTHRQKEKSIQFHKHVLHFDQMIKKREKKKR